MKILDNIQKQEDFIATDLESKDLEKRTKAADIVQTFFKDAAEVCNLNIIKNANLLTTIQDDNRFVPELVTLWYLSILYQDMWYENSDFAEKCRQMFKGVTLDVCKEIL